MLLRDKVFGDRTVVHDLGHARARRHVRRRRRHARPARRGRPRLAGPRRRQPVRLPAPGHRLRRQAPAGARPRRHRRPRRSTRSRQLVRAAGGRTLGLFSSMRAARGRDRGDARAVRRPTSRSSARARTRPRRWCASSPATPPPACSARSRSGRASTCPARPASSCIIDRIPFPRPDDPLASARSQAIARMGGNGFMAVSATHAALRLAQGAGRLVRRGDDRGVVAFLDSRMMTARYAGFLQRSLPPFWPTTDRRWCWPPSSGWTRRRPSRCRCTSRRCAGTGAAADGGGARRRRRRPAGGRAAAQCGLAPHGGHPGPRVDPGRGHRAARRGSTSG